MGRHSTPNTDPIVISVRAAARLIVGGIAASSTNFGLLLPVAFYKLLLQVLQAWGQPTENKSDSRHRRT